MSRGCVNEPDSFCYVCGELTLKKHRCAFTPIIKTAYHLYFGCQIGEQDKKWSPHSCCIRCANNLRAWMNSTRKGMPFAIPMIWREPKDHINDCYFCITKIEGFSAKSKHKIKYPDLHSAMRPVSHNEELPIPKPPENFIYDDAAVQMEVGEAETASTSSDINYAPDINDQPHLINQEELNDLVWDLNLSKKHAELLGSRLQGWNFLEKNTNISTRIFLLWKRDIKVEPGLTDEDTITDYHNSNEELRDPLELDIDNVSFKEENNYMDESIKVKVEPDSSDDDINYVSSDNYENDSSEETSKTDIQNIIQIKEDPIEECDKSKKVSVDVPTAINKEIPADKDQQIKTSKPVIRDQNEIRDDCQIFGDFVAGELRNLKSDDNRKKIKRIIQKVIIEISESED